MGRPIVNRVDSLADWLVHRCDQTGMPVPRAEAVAWIVATYGVATQTAGRDLSRLIQRGGFDRVWDGWHLWPSLAPPPPERRRRVRVGSVHVLAAVT